MAGWSPERQVQLKTRCKFIQISVQDLGVIPLGAETLLTEAADFVFSVTRKCFNSTFAGLFWAPLEGISCNDLQALEYVTEG